MRNKRHLPALLPVTFIEDQEGQVSTITKAFSKVETRPYYQTQNLSMTENDFLFLIQQKKLFLKK